MKLAKQVNVYIEGVQPFSLPAGHILTSDNLHQLIAHHAEYIHITETDCRSDEQIASEAGLAARRIEEIFSGADLSDQNMKELFNQVLIFRSQ